MSMNVSVTGIITKKRVIFTFFRIILSNDRLAPCTNQEKCDDFLSYFGHSYKKCEALVGGNVIMLFSAHGFLE